MSRREGGIICLCTCICICNVYAFERNASSVLELVEMRAGISVFGDYSEEGERRRGGAGVRDHKSV